MASELQTIDGGMGSAVSIYRSPEQALAEATRCAKALADVMGRKKNPVMFPVGKNGPDGKPEYEQYLENEDWQTVAYFYGHTAKIVSTGHVDYGDMGSGFEATAVLCDHNGIEVSRAESMCLNTETNWGMVSEYAWVDVLDENGKKIWDGKLFNGKGGYKRTKEKVGETPKPLFQLRSMAQTRALSKVIANKFKWVVVLAGYGATPAEEMTGNEFAPEAEKNPPPSAPDIQKKSDRTQPVQTTQATQTQPAQTQATQAQPETVHADPNAEPDIRPKSQRGNTNPSPQSQQRQEPAKAAQHQAPQGQVMDDPTISEPQQKRYFGIMKSAQVTDDQAKAQLASLGYTGHRNMMPRRIYTQAVDLLDPEFKFHTRDQGR